MTRTTYIPVLTVGGPPRWSRRPIFFAATLLLAILGPPVAVLAVPISPGDILVINQHDGLVLVNPTTGAQTLISSGGFFANPLGVALEPSGQAVIADPAVGVIRVDPNSGAQTLLSGRVDRFVLSGPRSVVVAPNGDILVVDEKGASGGGEVVRIDPAERRVSTSAGVVPYDRLLIALGADLEPNAIEGFAEAARHPYSLEAAVGLRDAVRRFRGGRVLVGVSRLPFKCPAAPYETALLLDARWREAGLRDKIEMEMFTPEPYPTPSAGEAIGRRVEGLLRERGIPVHAKREMDHVDAASRTVHFKGGGALSYDLLVAVPPHTTSAAVRESGLARDGAWVPVDPRTMRAAYDDVYAVGDVTKIATPSGKVPFLPKAGVFAERQAQVAAANIAASLDGGGGAQWDGRGVCFLEAGRGRAGMVTGNFYGDGPPEVRMRAPSRLWHWSKIAVERWWMRRFSA